MANEEMKTGMTDNAPEALREREQYFEQVDLMRNISGCGDERPVIGADETLIGIFGGAAANVSWTEIVLLEAASHTPLSKTFALYTADITRNLVNNGVRTSVHSDDHTEHSDQLIPDLSPTGDIGCGYLKLRRTISQVIGRRHSEIINILTRERPESYDNPQGQQRLKKYIDANSALAEQDGLFTSGRDVARQSIEQGSEKIVVTGEHIAKVGLLNYRSGTAFNTTEAMTDDRPAYVHDSWAALRCFREAGSLAGQFVRAKFEAANDVDAVGTMLALGVEKIYARE